MGWLRKKKFDLIEKLNPNWRDLSEVSINLYFFRCPLGF
jgi:hypothetical protein